MESQRLRECLDTDFHRLREIATGADLRAEVPSCPGWTMRDLLRHVSEVYLHKTESMRLGSQPDPWPPAGLDEEPPLRLLDRSYGALTEEFAKRRPEDETFTWYGPDQSVGFWIRRMAQETVIHRVDAELGAGVAIAPIPDDLAADGIDELLVAMVEYGTTNWPEEFADLLASAGDRAVRVTSPQRSWPLRLSTTGVRVEQTDSGSPDATVVGPAPDMLLWMWNRGRDGTTITGDEEAIGLLRQVVVESTQ